MRRVFLGLLIAGTLCAQDLPQVLKDGEGVFNKTCATGYCHGAKGLAGGAPRLVARGFDQGYINTVVSRGVPGTAMPAFAGTLSRADLVAVVAYVATLNGILNPNLNAGPGGPRAAGPAEAPLPPQAAKGRDLFFDAVRGFGRCSTCHEVNGVGMPVAAPIGKVPKDVRDLRGLATPDVGTAVVDGESMPALVLSQGKQRTVFYDLTSVPPVQRTVDPGAVKISAGSDWQHASVIGVYNDAELESILAFLRAAVKP